MQRQMETGRVTRTRRRERRERRSAQQPGPAGSAAVVTDSVESATVERDIRTAISHTSML